MEDNKKITELKGANIDLLGKQKVEWEQDKCLWNESEKTNEHKCAVKNISLCKYFKGIKNPDKVLCTFPN